MKRKAIASMLVRRDDNLGDCVLAIPVVRELRRNFPTASLVLMVKPQHRALFHGFADEFLDPVPRDELARFRVSFDLVVDIDLFLPHRYRPTPIRPGRLIRIGVPDWSKPTHIYRSLLQSLAQHGIPVRYAPPRIQVDPRSAEIAARLFEKQTPDPEHLNVAINASSGFPHKRWPLDRFLVVCRWLVNEYDARLFIVGTSGDRKEHRNLSAELPSRNAVVVSNRSIDVVAAVLKHVDLYLGNDSGIAHVAAGVGVPTVTIFGPTSPSYWRPANNKSIVVLAKADGCPCGYERARRCSHQVCLLSLTPDNVIDAVNRCINKHIGRGTKTVLDRIRLSDGLSRKQIDRGMLLRNTRTGHSCVVTRGWKAIRSVIAAVDKTNSYTRALEDHPKDRLLLDFLIMHRLVVPGVRRVKAT